MQLGQGIFADGKTEVKSSRIQNAGKGLFAAGNLSGNCPLYNYTGVVVPKEEADRYPNAYHFKLKDGTVLDGSQEPLSPCMYVNTLGPSQQAKNNCYLEEHKG